MRVLATGATGYIGGRLVPRLLRHGHTVRVLVRDPSRLAGRPWADRVELACGDLLRPETLEGAFEGIDAAYYLVHSMYTGSDFAARDRQAAENFCRAAANVRHVIYLGGLLPQGKRVSKHLGSRAEIGRILADRLPTTEFRAGPIIGSGSASFEMLRYLTERIPLMIAPAWVINEIQPIAVRDVLAYLIAALERGPSDIVEIGGDRLTYKQMMLAYARLRGLYRWILAVPPLIPARFGARLMGLVTPIPSCAGRSFGRRHDAAPSRKQGARKRLVRSNQADPLSEGDPVGSRSYSRTSSRNALEWRQTDDAPTYEHRDLRGLAREVRSIHVDASPDDVYRVFSSLGGEHGWLTWNWAWRVRGFMDQLLGGPGLRRGRRHPRELLSGEVVDFWRVESLVPPHLLRLRAEAKLPGQAWLQWEAVAERGGTRLTQTAAFAPHGLLGALYWYSLYPFHRLIFTDMINAIGLHASSRPDPPLRVSMMKT